MKSIETTLAHFNTLDDLARRDTPVGRIDARAKVLVVLAFLVTVASFHPHDLSRPLPLFILLAAWLALGEVPMAFLAARVAIASPFALLIGIWNPLFDARPLVDLGPITLSAGWVSLCSILLRFVLALAGVLLLVATTGFDRVCVALGRLGVPRVLVTQLVLLYRYAFVLADEAARMLRAHAMRCPGHPRPSWRTAGSLLGQLLIRSIHRAERVYTAMLCRGYHGSMIPYREGRFRWIDLGFLLGCWAFLALVRTADWPRIASGLVP